MNDGSLYAIEDTTLDAVAGDFCEEIIKQETVSDHAVLEAGIYLLLQAFGKPLRPEMFSPGARTLLAAAAARKEGGL